MRTNSPLEQRKVRLRGLGAVFRAGSVDSWNVDSGGWWSDSRIVAPHCHPELDFGPLGGIGKGVGKAVEEGVWNYIMVAVRR